MKDKDIFAVTAIAEVEDDKEALEVGMPFSSIFFSHCSRFRTISILVLVIAKITFIFCK